jgi:hypothetical protein
MSNDEVERRAVFADRPKLLYPQSSTPHRTRTKPSARPFQRLLDLAQPKLPESQNGATPALTESTAEKEYSQRRNATTSGGRDRDVHIVRRPMAKIEVAAALERRHLSALIEEVGR